jgi:hypothetical protein
MSASRSARGLQAQPIGVLTAWNGIVTALRACGPPGGSVAKGITKISYNGYRFPPEIIQQAIWLYLRFTLSFRGLRIAEASSLSRVVSRRFPLDVANAPFDDHAGSTFTVDDDLGATARPIRRREKNALLDGCLLGRRFEKPSSPVRQNTQHGAALANSL